MEIVNDFEVPAPVDRVWAYMLDIDRVVPCMPGASLTETVDETNWKGKIAVKLGPVSLNFAGKVQMAERDESVHRIVLKASGMEQRGKGAANATVTSTLDSIDGGTKVHVVQDLKVSGQAAQFSRGMMQDVSSKLTKQFADCLKTNMSAEDEAAVAPEAAATAGAPGAEAAPETPPPAVQTAKPIGGFRLAVGALGSAIARFFKKVFRRKSSG